jgi:hypothetical protein
MEAISRIAGKKRGDNPRSFIAAWLAFVQSL